jgi:ArsR family transcriptional regulator
LGRFGNVEVRRGELEALPLKDEQVDAATLILVLHHLPDPAKAVAEVARILRPGGKLVVVDMLPHERVEYRQEMGHVWMGFSERRIRRYLSGAGLASIRVRALPPEPSAKGPALFAASATAPAVTRLGGRRRTPRSVERNETNRHSKSRRSSGK